MFLRATEMNPSNINLGGFFDVNRNLFKSVRIILKCLFDFFEKYIFSSWISFLQQWLHTWLYYYNFKLVYQMIQAVFIIRRLSMQILLKIIKIIF